MSSFINIIFDYLFTISIFFMQHTVSERIKQVRKKLDLTQKEFAEGLKIKQSSISTIEGGGNPDINTLVNIGITYNIDLNWLLTEQGAMFKNASVNKTGRELENDVMRLQTLSEDLQDQVLMLVREKKELERKLEGKKTG